MLKALRLLILFLPVPLFADTEPRVVLRMQDGSQVELTQPRTRARIVEFHEAPLVARTARTSATSYQHTFQRFRRDLGMSPRSGGPAATAAHRITREFYRVFHGVSVTLDDSELAHVRNLPYVKAVHEDEPVKSFANEDLTRIARIGADRVWSEWKTRGAGIVVAVIDTGVDASHPSLAGKVIGGWDFVDNDEDPADENGHGTHVAGIIAGAGAGVEGVAPDAKILSYRVLDEDGRGSTSNIVAALEWAVDPDRDNDFSDHADVANLSLGGRGNADSPASKAADLAVEAGVVVCLAAGNTPGGQTIGSPAASRLSLTVGAADASDVITPWSSRGPSFPGLGLKPEIVAPGNGIISAKMGGGTIAYSGTSMAAPHVAGSAALLLALHPEWTPSDVKAALVGTADPLADDTMAQGGGRLNVYAAAGRTIAIESSVVTFGNGRASEWNASRTVRVANRGTEARTFTATSTAMEGATMLVQPESFTLAAGESRDVVLTATIADDAEPSAVSFAVGGHVSFSTSDGTARVPWVAIDAAEVRLTYDAPLYQTIANWACEGGSFVDARRESEQLHAALLPYRLCGLTVFASPAEGSDAGEVFVLIEKHQVADDLNLQRSPSDSTHALQLAGVDENGALLQPKNNHDTPYYTDYAFSNTPQSLHRFGGVLTYATGPLHVNSLEDLTITASQVFFDFPGHRLYSIRHEPVPNIHSSQTLVSLPSDLHHARVNVAPQSENVRLVGTVFFHSGGRTSGYSRGEGVSVLNGWRGDVYVTGEPDPNAWAAAGLSTARLRLPDPETDIVSEAIRWVDGRFVLSNEKVPSPAAYSVAAGGTIRVGETLLRASTFVWTHDTAFFAHPSYYGPAGELVMSQMSGFEYEIHDASGTKLGEGTANLPYVSADPGALGTYRVTIRSARGPQFAISFDTSREDSNPPTLTSLRILGADETIVTGVAPGDPATLAFSVGDYHSGGENRGRYTGAVRATRASWRTPGGDWQNLPITLLLEDRGDPLILGHLEIGLHYRADLTPITTSVLGDIELRIEAEDATGNSAAVTFDDALSIGARRRSMRR